MAGTKRSKDALAALSAPYVEETREEELRRTAERRDAVQTLRSLGLPVYDYGTNIDLVVPHLDSSLSVGVSKSSTASDVLLRVVEGIYKAGFEAGQTDERERQADALMAAVPSLADRMRKIAEDAIREAKIEEGRERDYR